MKPFTFASATSLEQLSQEQQQNTNASLIGGGTCLVDLMKLYVMQPDHLVNVRKVLPVEISDRSATIYIGAGATNSAVAHNGLIARELPALSQALLSGASPQLRNAATIGGNVMQRTRCLYFRDTAVACNKRSPGTGCGAMDGYNRSNAILGCSDQCIATHPSDMCVAMAMFDTMVYITDGTATREVPFVDFHVIPDEHPEVETVLKPGEFITGVEIAKGPLARNSHYLKVRDRASFSFALTSAAVALQTNGGVISCARLAIGGVATKPWRALEAEKLLSGKVLTDASFKEAAEAALHGATPRKHNKFKVELAKRTIVRAYHELQQRA